MRQARTTAVSAAATFALTGAFLSALALSQHGQNAADCGAGDCSAVIASRWATLPPGADLNAGFGLPVALLGLMYFSGLAGWLWIAFRQPSASPAMHRAVLGVAGLAAATSVAYLGMMAFQGIWCPLCLAIHFVNFAMLPFLWSAAPDPDAQPSPALGWQLTAAVCLMLAACELAVWFGWDSYRVRGQNREMAVALAQSNSSVAAGYRPDPPATFDQGSAAAPAGDSLLLVTANKTPAATLEIFTDIMCPSCRTFEDTLLKDHVPLFDGRLNVVLRHYPLASECNPGRKDLHPWACEAAYLVEAVRQLKDRDTAIAFMHDIDPAQPASRSAEELQSLAKKHGLDYEKLMQASGSDAVKARVAADVKLGQAKKLTSTPSLFLDGKPVGQMVRHRPEFWQAAAERAGVAVQPVADSSVNQDQAVSSSDDAEPDAATRLANDPEGERKLAAAKVMLETNDLDLDGVLDAKEAAKLYKSTTKIDLNRDGKIDLTEVAVGIARFTTPDPRKAAADGTAKPAEQPRSSTIFPGDVLALSGPTLDGQQFELNQWQGKPVVVAFWATWCGACVEETAELKRLYQTYHDRGLEIVGISSDPDLANVEEFVSKNQLPWPQLISADPATRGKWNPWAVQSNVRAIPTVILVGADGKVADVHLRGRALELAIAKEMKVEPVSEETAAQEVEAIKEALVRPVDSKHVPDPLEVGDLASVAGTTIDGGRFELSALRGKAVLVAFWATWCPHCRKELPALQELYARYKDRGLEIVGVSLDRKSEDLKKFLGESPLPWPTIYLDQDGLRSFNNPLTYWFGVKGIPALYLIDQQGRVAAIKPRGATLEKEVAKLLGEAPPATPVATPTEDAQPKASPSVKASLLTDPEVNKRLAVILIKRYDVDMDGALTKEEWSKSKTDYGPYDVDGDGKISAEEMTTAVTMARKFKAAKDAKQLKPKAEQPLVPSPDGTEAP